MFLRGKYYNICGFRWLVLAVGIDINPRPRVWSELENLVTP